MFLLWPEVAEISRSRPTFEADRTLAPSLRELCERLARADDLRSGIEAVAWACDGVFPFYRVALAFPTRRPGRLFVAAAWARNAGEELEGFDFSVCGHPLEGALVHGSTVVRTNPSEDHGDRALLGLYEGEGKVEELGAPLDLRGRRGLLIFASREKGSFGEGARAWVEDAARVISLWAHSWAGPDAPEVLKEQYETVLEGSLDGIAVQQRGTLEYANSSFLEIFGLPLDAPVPRDFTTLLTPASVPAFREAVAALAHRPRFLPRLAVESRSRSGRPLYLDLGLQQIFFQGEPAVLIQVHNSTERAEREQEIRESYSRVDSLIHTLAHDIRGPLTTIVGFSELMVQREMQPEQLRESLDVVCRVSRRLRELVEGLLSYSALGSSEGAMVDVSTSKLLEEVEAELEGLLASTGADLSYRRIPPDIRGRPMELGRVFKNLIENAIHYAKPGEKPEVEVSCVGDEGGAHLFCVKDNGIGIAPERARDVFRLFHRGASGGVGLGLAIVERVVQAHSGRVWVESEPGEGSRFYFTLPKPNGCSLAESAPAEEAARTDL